MPKLQRVTFHESDIRATFHQNNAFHQSNVPSEWLCCPACDNDQARSETPARRLSLGEALTNLVWARATSLPDVRASVNWMYAAKMKSEGVAMYDAAVSLK